jgi:2-polyprenyl-6-methoxyphenol hydroxylase-like FAD-dependent oxidoreductase
MSESKDANMARSGDDMLAKHSKVAIIGGSIAGCAAYIALASVGVERITVYERSEPETLKDRGYGVGLLPSTLEDLRTGGFIGSDYRYKETVSRHWFLKDESYSNSKGQLL